MHLDVAQTARDYRSLLKEELERRCQHNSRYSLRAMARDLGLAPARLSDVLRGRYGLSKAAATSIGEGLGWSPEEVAYFCDLVDATHARRKHERTEAQNRLKESDAKGMQLSLDRFRLIADWHHYGILELLQIESAKSDPRWIAEKLGLAKDTVVAALKRLERLSLLIYSDDRATPQQDFVFTPSDVPSGALRRHHQQLMEKAQRALYSQTVKERDISSIVMAVDASQMDEAKKMIKAFRRQFNEKFGRGGRKNAVYCLAVQFFRLNEKTTKRGIHVVH
ncbi:MAG: TIGR02147 family protein [Deltaproteobacteria bacterium]|nr:TIGR02147 family protein [Deltaproteobacteria bacterium]MBI3294564.1 TIGR02147 family protein [Deltaproteobacteria bacterium]